MCMFELEMFLIDKVWATDETSWKQKFSLWEVAGETEETEEVACFKWEAELMMCSKTAKKINYICNFPPNFELFQWIAFCERGAEPQQVT